MYLLDKTLKTVFLKLNINDMIKEHFIFMGKESCRSAHLRIVLVLKAPWLQWDISFLGVVAMKGVLKVLVEIVGGHRE